MVRARGAHDRTLASWRLLTPLLIVALLFGVDATVPPQVAAGAAGVAGMRGLQARAEGTMLRADKQVRKLTKQRHKRASRVAKSKHKLDRLIDRRSNARARVGRISDRLETARAVRDRALRVRPNPSGKQISDKPTLRKHVNKLNAKHSKATKKVRKAARAVHRARKEKRQATRTITRARIVARKAARERAEDRLGAAITRMLALSKQRAGSSPAISAPRSFRRPAKGTISQGYGCTGYRANKRRGKCRYFHDGIDIASPRGTRVRASADGYVAYAGRNPWDTGRRAFVVIVGHAGGYETVYAHLKPVRKVKAGQRIRRGQVLGVVGMTGRTSGPHVHWEVSRNFRTLDPKRAGR